MAGRTGAGRTGCGDYGSIPLCPGDRLCFGEHTLPEFNCKAPRELRQEKNTQQSPRPSEEVLVNTLSSLLLCGEWEGRWQGWGRGTCRVEEQPYPGPGTQQGVPHASGSKWTQAAVSREGAAICRPCGWCGIRVSSPRSCTSVCSRRAEPSCPPHSVLQSGWRLPHTPSDVRASSIRVTAGSRVWTSSLAPGAF